MNRSLIRGLRAGLRALDGAERAFARLPFGSAPRQANETPPRRVLLWTMDRIGDVQRATGLIRQVKARWPFAELTVVVAARSGPVLENNPHLTAIHAVPSPYDLRGHARILRDLRRQRFDLGILAEVDPFWVKLGHWSMRFLGVPRWAAFELGVAAPRRCVQVALAPDRSWTELFGALGAAVGAPVDGAGTELHLSGLERSAARAILSERGIAPDRPFVLVHPGGNFLTVSRQWPAEHFARLIDLIHGTLDVPVAVSGLAQERATVEKIRALCAAPFVDLCSLLSLRELAAVVDASALCVTNDTGPLHLAQALQRPTVAILGPTSPGVVGLSRTTRAVFADLPCRPCAFLGGWTACRNPDVWACLRRLSPEDVFTAVNASLSPASARPHEGSPR